MDALERVGDSEVEVAGEVGGERRPAARLVGAAPVVVDQRLGDPLRGGVDLAAQVVFEAAPARVDVERRGAEDRQAQQPVDHGVLEIGLVAGEVETERTDQYQSAHQLGSVDGDLHRVGRRESGGDEHRPPPDDVVQEVDQEVDVELGVVVDRGAVGAPPAGQIGGEDLEPGRQALGRLAELRRVVAGAEGVQQDQGVAFAQALEEDVAEIPGVAVPPPPGGGFDLLGFAGDGGVDQGGHADRGAADQQPLQDPLPAPPPLLFLGRPGGHGTANVTTRRVIRFPRRAGRLVGVYPSARGVGAGRGKASADPSKRSTVGVPHVSKLGARVCRGCGCLPLLRRCGACLGARTARVAGRTGGRSR